jgi:hypothetical protein
MEFGAMFIIRKILHLASCVSVTGTAHSCEDVVLRSVQFVLHNFFYIRAPEPD